MSAAHYAPESIICAMKYDYISCCVLAQVFISAAVSMPADVPSSPLQSVLAPGAGADSVPAAPPALTQGDADQDVQLRDVPALVLAALPSQAALSLSIEAALRKQEEHPAPRMFEVLDG